MSPEKPSYSALVLIFFWEKMSMLLSSPFAYFKICPLKFRLTGTWLGVTYLFEILKDVHPISKVVRLQYIKYCCTSKLILTIVKNTYVYR